MRVRNSRLQAPPTRNRPPLVPSLSDEGPQRLRHAECKTKAEPAKQVPTIGKLFRCAGGGAVADASLTARWVQAVLLLIPGSRASGATSRQLPSDMRPPLKRGARALARLGVRG